MLEMNAAIRDQWVAALESGEYKQGKGALAEVGEEGKIRYCCLGVLCDLAVKAGVVEVNESPYGHLNYGRESGGVLPDSVSEWAGLVVDGNPLEDPMVDGAFLSAYNDDLEYTFAEIAAKIKA